MRSMHPIRVYERQGADLNVTEDGLRSPHGPSHRLALTVGKCSGRDQFPDCVSKPTMGFEPMTPALRERCSGQLSYVGGRRSLARRQGHRAVLSDRPERVVGDLPGVAIRVREDAGVTTPRRLCGGAGDGGARALSLGDHCVDLLR